MADKRLTNPKNDFDLYFEPGFEDTVREHLRSNAFRAFQLIPDEAESRRLVRLLCYVVYCGTQFIKIDPLTELLAGMAADNLKNYPERIERFCDELKQRLDKSPHMAFDLACDNTQEINKAIATVRGLADQFRFMREDISSNSEHWRSAYSEAICALATFMTQKTNKARFPSLEKLLNETAKALQKNQIYRQKSLREIVQYHLPK